jgi:hypothetical protein
MTYAIYYKRNEPRTYYVIFRTKSRKLAFEIAESFHRINLAREVIVEKEKSKVSNILELKPVKAITSIGNVQNSGQS